ncbi:uncharacterized protein [Onthophagus taurus]|uniref:uncharacterized protein n=1 Tax=Onthophagus taurus TaxID=166361 RepID=UPI0039BDF2F3
MILKTLIFLIALSSIKAAPSDINTKWIYDVLNKFNPEITELKVSIETLANKTTDNVVMLSSGMLRIILVRNESDTLIASLKSVVKTTIDEATQEKIEIESCVDDELKSQENLEINLNEKTEQIEAKYNLYFEEFLGESIKIKNLLPDLNRKIDESLRNCALHHFLPWHEDELIECINRDIEQSKSEISEINSNIVSIITKAEELFGEMEIDVVEMTKNVLLEMFGIIETLKVCIVMIKPETTTFVEN